MLSLSRILIPLTGCKVALWLWEIGRLAVYCDDARVLQQLQSRFTTGVAYVRMPALLVRPCAYYRRPTRRFVWWRNNSTQMIKTISFDFYNTLVKFWPALEEIQQAACREMGITVSTEAISLGYSKADVFFNRENETDPLALRSEEDRLNFFSCYEQMILEAAGVPVSIDLLELFRTLTMIGQFLLWVLTAAGVALAFLWQARFHQGATDDRASATASRESGH